MSAAQALLLAQRRQQRMAVYRAVILTLLAIYFCGNAFEDQLYPWGTAVSWPGRDEYSALDLSNTLLQAKHGKLRKIYQRLENEDEPSLIKGTETMIFDTKGNTMYTMNEEGALLSVTDIQPQKQDGVTNSHYSTTKVSVVRHLGIGRPLSGRFAKDGTLWIADAVLGLTRIKNPTNPKSKVELIVSSVPRDDGKESKINFMDDLTIGPETGKIYFTDATNVEPTRIGTRTWDVWYPSKLECMRGFPSGRLLSYDPATDVTQVLATGFRFANGLDVSPDESYILLAETFGMRVWKYHIKGPATGEMEVLVSHMPGYPDGISCAPPTSKDDHRCFVVMPAAIIPFHKLVAALPDTLDTWIRHLLMALPRWITPDAAPFAGVMIVNALTGEHEYLLDPNGTDLAKMSGITYKGGKLYMGSLKDDYIAEYTL